MKVKYICAMSIAVLVLGCTSKQQRLDAFKDYPVYEGEWKEIVYSPIETKFQLWAPTASEARVLLYEQGQGGSTCRMIKMQPDKKGMWMATEAGNLKGKFYAFNVKIDDVWQGDTPGVMAQAVGVNGNRAAIVDMKQTNPLGWEKDVKPSLKNFSDIIVYEMHHRDFSIDTISGIKHGGKYLALTESGTHTYLGETTGIDHLKELGVTHVHLLPSFDFSSIDETQLNKPQYNWGYDPQNYNVPEGSYATNPFLPEVRIKEFKQMVMSLHKAGIRVVMDVVYNHTSGIKGSAFERTVPGYFYRTTADGKTANASGCGNETASERPMVRKFMVESVCYWAKEYHIDGFRFDLMGVHDIETMQSIRKALDEIDPTIFIYGEGWAAEKPQLPDSLLAMKQNMRFMPGIAAFSDEFRDGLRGPFGKDTKGGFVVGRPHYEAAVRFGIVGGIDHPQVVNDSIKTTFKSWNSSPQQFISYVSSHDDLCLTDRFRASVPGASMQELSAWQKLAETAILTSQGVPFLFAGDEVMRSKQGVANSYNRGDSINAINWGLKTVHRDVFDYVKGMIALRKGHPAFRMGNPDLIRRHLEFIHVPATNVVAFRLKGNPCGDHWLNTIVILNARTEPIKVQIPDGKYWVACRDGRVDLVLGLGVIQGNEVTVSPVSALIIHQ